MGIISTVVELMKGKFFVFGILMAAGFGYLGWRDKNKIHQPIEKDNIPKIKVSESGMPYVEESFSGKPGFKDFVQNAVSLFAIGENEKALNEINLAIAIDDSDPDCYHIRGSIKKSLGDKVGAIHDWCKCNDLGGNAHKLIRENIN
jgi:hypothetical protein